MHKQQQEQFMHNLEESSYAQKCEGGDPKLPGTAATVSINLRGPRANRCIKSCLFLTAINSKDLKLFL